MDDLKIMALSSEIKKLFRKMNLVRKEKTSC